MTDANVWNGDMATADGLRQARKLARDGSMVRMYVQHDPRDGGSRIVLAADVKDRWVKDSRTVYLRMPTESGFCNVAASCVAGCYGCVIHHETVLDMLRPADELRLVWHRGGAESEVIRRAGLVGDICDLHIRRKAGTKRIVYPISWSVGADNMARMIRLAGVAV